MQSKKELSTEIAAVLAFSAINNNDKVFYFTTCGWMMWNWLVSCLASQATIYLYDGSPFYPSTDYLFNIIEKEKITFFGTGAKYLDFLKSY